jgi:hypothetical protein
VNSWKKLRKALQPGTREPLEVRNAILEDIDELVEPLGDGRRGLVHNRIAVRLLSADAARRGLLEGALAAEDGLAAAVARRMQAHGHFTPPDLSVQVINDAAPALTSAERDYEIAASVEGKPAFAPAGAPAPPPEAEPRPRPRARLVVIEEDGPGRAVEIDRDVFNVGRLKEVRERSHRPARRNDLYFDESQASISRQHAHIRYYPKTGEFRIFDDQSSRGTRLFSDGRPIDVPPGRSRGEQLHSGDEIYFGSVAVRFEILA